MPILDKPFNFNEMLRRTIFKGRPNFFNAKDFNKELELIHSFMEEFNKVFAVHSDRGAGVFFLWHVKNYFDSKEEMNGTYVTIV